MFRYGPPPKYNTEQLRHTAEEFRNKHWVAGKLPIDIMAIIEFDLEMEIRPLADMREVCDTDALLISDLRTICVDQKLYMDRRYENRLRFSLAHELGHKLLHGDYYRQLNIQTADDLLSFHASLNDQDYSFIEWHANEFAGRLLVPVDSLVREVQKLLNVHAKELKSLNIELHAVLEQLSLRLAPVYGVSPEALDKRIDKENVLVQVSLDAEFYERIMTIRKQLRKVRP